MSQKLKKYMNDGQDEDLELDADTGDLRNHRSTAAQVLNPPSVSSSDPRRRDRSPSAMSQSSAVLEWDPSADVGAMASAGNRIVVQGSSKSRENQLRALENIESCQILFGPKFKETSEQGLSRSSSQNSKSHQACAYSTPSASPVPLASLQYSPVAPDESSTAESKSREVLYFRSKKQKESNCTKALNVEDSSGSNNIDDLSEDRRTPGRVVSDASTDWEYDNEKKVSSKYVADWQTHGITRSEIEYSNRKKSGSSTSMASSVYYMDVHGNSKSQLLASPEESMKKSAKFGENNSKTESTELSEMDRKVQNILKGSSGVYKRRTEGESSGSDPSTMCMIVDHFMKIIEEDPEKDGIQYDVLKTHRDYHMTKVWKQISKLEQLNRALLSYKRKPVDGTGSSGTQKTSQREQVEQGVRACATMGDLKKLLKYHENDSPKERVKDTNSSNGKGRRSLDKAPSVQTSKISRRQLESEAGISSKEKTGVDEIIRNIVLEYFGGHSNPAFKSSSDYSDDENQNPMESKRLHNVKERQSANSKLKGGRSSVDVLSRYSKTKFQNCSSGTTSSTGNETRYSYHKKPSKNKVGQPNYEALGELVAKLVDAEAGNRQKEIFSRASQTSGIPTRSANKDEVIGKSDGRGYESDPSSCLRKKATNENLRSVLNELLGWHNMSSGGNSDKRNAKATVNAPKKSPVGFFVPLFCDSNDYGDSREETEKFNIKGTKPIHECLKERNPQCYKSIKERDDFLITIKRDRQIHNETLLREALEANMAYEDIDEYLKWNYRHGNEEEKRRLKTFWNLYMESKKFKDNKENEDVQQSSHVISSKEMKDRTQRLRMNDHLMLAKQRKEAEERRKRASRILQRNFSTNLRQFQKSGGVNIPDRMKLGPRPL